MSHHSWFYHLSHKLCDLLSVDQQHAIILSSRVLKNNFLKSSPCYSWKYRFDIPVGLLMFSRFTYPAPPPTTLNNIKQTYLPHLVSLMTPPQSTHPPSWPPMQETEEVESAHATSRQHIVIPGWLTCDYTSYDYHPVMGPAASCAGLVDPDAEPRGWWMRAPPTIDYQAGQARSSDHRDHHQNARAPSGLQAILVRTPTQLRGKGKQIWKPLHKYDLWKCILCNYDLCNTHVAH